MTDGPVPIEVRHQRRHTSISSGSTLSEIFPLEQAPTEAPIYGTGKIVDLHFDHEHRQGGLRRRPSIAPHDRTQAELRRPNLHERFSRHHQRAHSDVAHLESRQLSHPESRGKSIMPRSAQNTKACPRNSSPPNRAHRVSTMGDLESGVDQWAQKYYRHSSSEVSSDGYLYAHRQKKKFRNLSPGENSTIRLSILDWMDSSSKNHLVATIGEFVGTVMFLFFGFAGAQVANIGVIADATRNDDQSPAPFDISVYLYISVIFGFSLLVNVWVFYRISGALFNPAVTLGMVLVGAIPIMRAICLFFAQILGGITASALVLGLFPIPLNVRTSLGPGTSKVQGVFIEAFLTAELIFTIFMLAKEKHRATFLAPIGIGLALFISHLVGIHFTGSSLNPARSFGPCVVTGIFEEEHWIYWVGPFLGALFAVAFYKLIKLLEYEMANPGQDGDDENDPTKNGAKFKEILRRREKRFA